MQRRLSVARVPQTWVSVRGVPLQVPPAHAKSVQVLDWLTDVEHVSG